jgi:multidrug resistance protein, MATE family
VRLREIRQLLTLALPLILAQLAQTSMGFVDTLMVGRLGGEALAGIALGSTIFFFVFLVLSGVVLSVAPTVAQAHGAGDREAIAQAVRQGMWLAVILALPAMLLYWNVAPLLLFMGQDERTTALAASYLRAISFGVLPALWLVALRGLLEGLAEPRPILVITIFGVILNAAANSILMFGHFGFPALGLVGTGWASTIVYWTMFALALLYASYRYRALGVFRFGLPQGGMLLGLLSLGWPISLTLAFESGLFSVSTLLMGLIGATELAAHQLALQCAALAFMVPLGTSIATSVRVGQARGRGDLAAARRAGLTGMGLSVFFMCLTALLFLLFPRAIIGLYIDVQSPANAAVLAAAVVFLKIAALFQLFDGLQVSALGALRGLKDTRTPMLIALFSYWLVGFGVSVGLAFGLGWGGPGLWLGLVAGLATAAFLLAWRFLRRTAPAPKKQGEQPEARQKEPVALEDGALAEEAPGHD